MGFVRHLRRVSMAVMTGLIASLAWATDGALLEVLRHNKLITDVQYEALKKAQAEKAVSSRPLPAQDRDLLDVLLANGLISQAQYADLGVETAATRRNANTITSGGYTNRCRAAAKW